MPLPLCLWIGIAALPLGLWLARRVLLAASASRCPYCGSKFHAVPVCGDRRYERWHCRACDRDWDERYDDWDPRPPGKTETGTNDNPDCD